MKNTVVAVVLVWALLLSTAIGSLNLAGFGAAGSGDADDWPTLQHDITHSGVSSSSAPYTNVTLWNYTTHSGYSSPAVVNGSLYIASLSGVCLLF